MLCPVSLFASFIALGTSFFAPCARSFPNHLIKMLKSENYKKFSFLLEYVSYPRAKLWLKFGTHPISKNKFVTTERHFVITFSFCYCSNIFQSSQIISNQITCEMREKIIDIRFSEQTKKSSNCIKSTIIRSRML